MTFIRSLIFNIICYLTILFGCIVSTVFGFFVPQKWIINWWNYLVLPFVRWNMKAVCDLSIEIRGAENIQQQGSIFACKHQSAIETYILTSYLQKATYIFKKELSYIPFFGWAVAFYGSVPVNRSGGSTAMKNMLKEAKKLLDDGRSIIIFPEGTRTKPTLKGEYKPGLAFLYQNTDAPVIPVATNTGLFWAKKSFLRYQGKIIFQFLPAIPQGLPKKEFMDEIQKRIETACAAINAESFKNYPDALARLNKSLKAE